MYTPLVSIGLPVYNGARYLREAVKDFLVQSFGDFELILSDNASTDETEELCRDFEKLDARIRYVRNEVNIGALPNANQAIALARGKYFCLAAHDDRRSPEFLERLVSALESNTGAVLAYGRSTLIDEHGASLQTGTKGLNALPDVPGARPVDYDRKLERALPEEPLKRFKAVLQSNDVNSPVHGLFRTDVLRDLGGHRFHGSDRLLVAGAALTGRFMFVDEDLFSFRIHPDSTFFLDREAWVLRETGGLSKSSPADTLRTFGNYLKTVQASDLPRTQRLQGYLAAVRYAVRPTALRNLLLPGIDNYLGWRRWPWQKNREANGKPISLQTTTAWDA